MIQFAMFSMIGLVAATASGNQPSAQYCKPSAKQNTVALGAVGDDDKQVKESLATAYPFDTCPISGEKLGSMGEPVIKTYGDREVRFCCASCIKDFEADKAAHWKKIDEEIVKQQLPYYPTDTCVVSGEKLGSMGEPINHVWRNRLVRLCCSGCIKDLQADPKKYITKLDEAIVKQQREKYPLQTCVVSGQKLGSMGEPVEAMVANRLARLCCADCLSKIKAEPAKYLAKVNDAWKASDEKPQPDSATDKAHDHKRNKHADHDHDGHARP